MLSGVESPTTSCRTRCCHAQAGGTTLASRRSQRAPGRWRGQGSAPGVTVPRARSPLASAAVPGSHSPPPWCIVAGQWSYHPLGWPLVPPPRCPLCTPVPAPPARPSPRTPTPALHDCSPPRAGKSPAQRPSQRAPGPRVLPHHPLPPVTVSRGHALPPDHSEGPGVHGPQHPPVPAAGQASAGHRAGTSHRDPCKARTWTLGAARQKQQL